MPTLQYYSMAKLRNVMLNPVYINKIIKYTVYKLDKIYLKFQMHDFSFCVILTQHFLILETESVIDVQGFILV